MVIADIDDDILLGYDFLKSYNCILNLLNNTLTIGSEIIPAFEKRNPNASVSLHPVYITKRTVIPPNSSKFVKCCLSNGEGTLENLVIEPISSLPLLIPKSLVHSDYSFPSIAIKNLYHH